MSRSVAIVGAGPVGLYTALLLAKAGIEVTVFESEPGILQSPRALAYFPVVLDEFRKSGILDEVIAAGYINDRGLDFRDAKGHVLADVTPPPGSFAIQLGQPELAGIILNNLRQCPTATVYYDHKFVRLEQTEQAVTAFFEKGFEKSLVQHEFRYLVGADGGRSEVRKFLGIPLEGSTWNDWQFIAANIVYDLDSHGWKSANFVVDPVDWAIVAKLGKGSDWRVATGERLPSARDRKEFDREAVIKRLKEQYRRILPGKVEEIEFKNISPYIVHQRCVPSYRKGNVLLAGDSAHLNNPVGGLGLTTGLLDAAHLGGALIKIIVESASEDLLRSYSATRRKVFLENTGPTSKANMLRLYADTPEVNAEREHVFSLINSHNMDFLKAMAQQEQGLSSTRETANGHL